jgi:hypothetical protein
MSHPNRKQDWRNPPLSKGGKPDELVRQVVARYCDEESRFVDAVRRGEEALQRDKYLTHDLSGPAPGTVLAALGCKFAGPCPPPRI